MKIYGVKICYSPILKNQLKPISFLFIMSILDLICLKPIGYLYQFEHLYQFDPDKVNHVKYLMIYDNHVTIIVYLNVMTCQ